MSTPQDPYTSETTPYAEPYGTETTTSYTEPYGSGSSSVGQPYGYTAEPTEPEDPTKRAAKEEASQVKQTAAEAGSRVAGTAKAEAGNVATEAKQQAKGLVDRTTGEVRSQVNSQQQRLAGGVSALVSELESMADSADGPMAELARRGASRGSDVARWLENRDTSDVLDELRALARRRPWAFLAGAAAAGVVVGRLGKGLVAEKQESKAAASYDTTSYDATPGYATGTYDSTYAPSSYADASYASGTTVGTESVLAGTGPSYVESGTGYPDTDPAVSTDVYETDVVYDRPYTTGEDDLKR